MLSKQLEETRSELQPVLRPRRVKSGSKPGLFVHATVDDYGFTPHQFRVLGHISRRGDCFETIENIGAKCKIHVHSVRSSLKFLVAYNIIKETRRKGTTTVYTVRPEEEWVPLEGPSQNNIGPGRPKIIPAPLPKEMTDHPSQNNTDKVHPPEVIPMKVVGEALPAASTSGKPIRQDLYPREYDQISADAKRKIREYSRNSANYVEGKLKPEIQSAILQLEQRIHEVECAKFGVQLPKNVHASSRPVTAKPNVADPSKDSNPNSSIPPEVLSKYIKDLREAVDPPRS
jgi:hypothetical protein